MDMLKKFIDKKITVQQDELTLHLSENIQTSIATENDLLAAIELMNHGANDTMRELMLLIQHDK